MFHICILISFLVCKCLGWFLQSEHLMKLLAFSLEVYTTALIKFKEGHENWQKLHHRLDLYYIKTDWKRMSLYKWPCYDQFWPFFEICMFIFHKTEVQMVIRTCLTGLNSNKFWLVQKLWQKTEIFSFPFFCNFVQKHKLAFFEFLRFVS